MTKKGNDSAQSWTETFRIAEAVTDQRLKPLPFENNEYIKREKWKSKQNKNKELQEIPDRTGRQESDLTC